LAPRNITDDVGLARGLAARLGPPIEQRRLRDPGADVGVAAHADAARREPSLQIAVDDLDHRVAVASRLSPPPGLRARTMRSARP
jgi:hypothetical protein